VGARPMPEGMDPAPLVDFCNQNSPRAQPLISRSPSGAPEVALRRAFQVAPPRRLFQARPLRACPWSLPSEPDPFGPRAPAHGEHTPSEPRDLQAGHGARPGFRRHQPSSPRSGAVRQWRTTPPVQRLRRARAAGASPQPGPLGHLLSWDRGYAGWRARCSPKRAQHVRHAGRTSAIPPRRPSLRRACRPSCRMPRPAHARLRVRVPCACTPLPRQDGAETPSNDETKSPGPPHPSLREERRAPPHPRCLSSMSCPRARGLGCPQVVDNLWMEPGASRTFARSSRP
jgi:hypothetical protein